MNTWMKAPRRTRYDKVILKDLNGVEFELNRKNYYKHKSLFFKGMDFNRWADVWKIDESSKSYKIVGSLNDIFILELDESPSTGYIWDFKCLLNNNFKILTNIAVSTENIDDESLVKRLGSSIKRQIVFTNTELFEGKLEITKKRPWEGNFLEKKEINFSLNGRGQGFYKKYCK